MSDILWLTRVTRNGRVSWALELFDDGKRIGTPGLGTIEKVWRVPAALVPEALLPEALATASLDQIVGAYRMHREYALGIPG
jgi:hypothetical protein